MTDTTTEAKPKNWEGAEEWMPLAWELCANECGEEACTELIWEGGPIPEPWGDRWLKYEYQAKEMIAMVRASLAAVKSPAPAQPVDAGWNDDRMVELKMLRQRVTMQRYELARLKGPNGQAQAARVPADHTAVMSQAVAALEKLLTRDQSNTCTHENTHRGGAIWEICGDCGAKWSDDRNPKPKWKAPAEWEAAEAAITALSAALGDA